MKNNKGFTLVELMAVIVVLAIIIAIAVPSAITISHKIKLKMYDTKIDMILSSAKIYGQDNPAILSDKTDGTCSDSKGKVQVSTLVSKGYIKKDDTSDRGKVINPVDNSSLNGHWVCVYKKYNRVYATEINNNGKNW